MQDSQVLCAASADHEKYYFNPRFERLPESVKQELKASLVLFAEEVGGAILIVFSEEGDPQIQLIRREEDFLYDEIEAELQVSRLHKQKETLFLQLKAFYMAFFGEKA